MKGVFKKLIGFLTIVLLLVVLSFAKIEQEKIIVGTPLIQINNTTGDPFLSDHDIEDLVYTRLDTLEGKQLGKLNLGEIERLIESDASVKNAEVYSGIKGDVHLDVELKRVVARIKPDSTKGFYIDSEGEVMPWVAKYTPRVLTVTGNLGMYNRYLKDTLAQEDLKYHSKLIEDVFGLTKLIENDDYWQAQIGQIYIAENGDAVLIPLAGQQEFILGELKNCESKLEKIKIFHEEIAQKVGWGKYKVVNLKFDNQIVCN